VKLCVSRFVAGYNVIFRRLFLSCWGFPFYLGFWGLQGNPSQKSATKRAARATAWRDEKQSQL